MVILAKKWGLFILLGGAGPCRYEAYFGLTKAILSTETSLIVLLPNTSVAVTNLAMLLLVSCSVVMFNSCTYLKIEASYSAITGSVVSFLKKLLNTFQCYRQKFLDRCSWLRTELVKAAMLSSTYVRLLGAMATVSCTKWNNTQMDAPSRVRFVIHAIVKVTMNSMGQIRLFRLYICAFTFNWNFLARLAL